MDKTRKYPTYKALAEAFRKGELKDYVLVLDNDTCYLSFRGKKPAGMSDEAWQIEGEKRYEECQEWFHGDGYGDLEPLCEAAGIPAEWC